MEGKSGGVGRGGGGRSEGGGGGEERREVGDKGRRRLRD